MPMKTRLEEVNSELSCARDDIYSAVIDIGSLACPLVPKDMWSKLDAEIERYAELRIEKAELEKKQW